MARRSPEETNYTLRIPEAAMDKLKYIASRNDRSANKEIERIIMRYIKSFEEKAGLPGMTAP